MYRLEHFNGGWAFRFFSCTKLTSSDVSLRRPTSEIMPPNGSIVPGTYKWRSVLASILPFFCRSLLDPAKHFEGDGMPGQRGGVELYAPRQVWMLPATTMLFCFCFCFVVLFCFVFVLFCSCFVYVLFLFCSCFVFVLFLFFFVLFRFVSFCFVFPIFRPERFGLAWDRGLDCGYDILRSIAETTTTPPLQRVGKTAHQ